LFGGEVVRGLRRFGRFGDGVFLGVSVSWCLGNKKDSKGSNWFAT